MKALSDGVTGVLLAGGNSSRMGRNKALMTLAGHSSIALWPSCAASLTTC